jgi:hypothetical protein
MLKDIIFILSLLKGVDRMSTFDLVKKIVHHIDYISYGNRSLYFTRLIVYMVNIGLLERHPHVEGGKVVCYTYSSSKRGADLYSNLDGIKNEIVYFDT